MVQRDKYEEYGMFSMTSKRNKVQLRVGRIRCQM